MSEQDSKDTQETPEYSIETDPLFKPISDEKKKL